jgi:hypothetical protein
LRHHTDNLDGLGRQLDAALHQHGSADDLLIGRKLSLPQAVTDDGNTGNSA